MEMKSFCIKRLWSRLHFNKSLLNIIEKFSLEKGALLCLQNERKYNLHHRIINYELNLQNL